MEYEVCVHIERLPEGVYLATSDEVQGLVAQSGTIEETIEVARDLVRKLIETRTDSAATHIVPTNEVSAFTLIVSLRWDA